MVSVADHRSSYCLSIRETVLFLLSNTICNQERIDGAGKESSTCHHSHGHKDFAKEQKALRSTDIICSLCELVE